MSGSPSDKVERPYLDAISDALSRAAETNAESLPAAASLVADVVARDGIVYVYGSGHSQLTAMDLSRRAGSLVPLQVIYDPIWGRSEAVVGFGMTLLAGITFTPADCLFVISSSGATVAPIEVALAAREAGTKVVSVTANPDSRPGKSRHPSGKKLAEVGDIVLDNATQGTDLAVPVGPTRVGATTTVIATALLHEVIVEAVLLLAARGIAAPTIRANAEEGGAAHNARVLKPYTGRLTPVP